MSLDTVDEVRVYFRRKWRRPKTRLICPIPQVIPVRKQSIRRRLYRKPSGSGSGSDGVAEDVEFVVSRIDRDFYDANNDDGTRDDGDGDDDGAADEEDDLINAYQDEAEIEAEDIEETYNDGGVLSSDGSDDGGSDLYGSDPDKYDNMEAFDMDHQSVASIDADDDGGDDNDEDEVDVEADALADQLSIESRDKIGREYDGLEFMEQDNQEQRDDEDQEDKKLQQAIASAEQAAIETMMAEEVEEDGIKEAAAIFKQAELEADDIDQLCMELDELQALEQGLAIPQRLENAAYAPGRAANVLDSDSESTKLCHGDSSIVQSSSENRNLKTTSDSSTSVKGPGMGNANGDDSEESAMDNYDEIEDNCEISDNDDFDNGSDASYDDEY